MKNLTVKQTDVYINLNNKYMFSVDWSDSDCVLSFEYDTLNEALKWWGKSDSMISGFPQGGIVKYSDFPNCQAIAK